jgi:hypothetical protein
VFALEARKLRIIHRRRVHGDRMRAAARPEI